ncbi:phage tail tape measure protein [Ensifer sp. LCM 4579]|uniref:phage tail tape measure protein n=1 Tax=Ensifer sp. LCM 4579 TaxID=1848292 RepID=UPI0008DAAE4F|nr:phage tail tape measure protein [Ensifer sp. LCM 4579]OHV85813.1 phage tail tape measure protein [Ensifer sp. LCM 4579]
MTADAQVRLSLVDRLTGPIKRIGARLGALSKKIGLDRIAVAAGNVGRKFRGVFDGMQRSVLRLSSALAVVGASFGGIVAGSFSLAQSAASLGDEVAKTSRQLGIGAVALQELRYAAKMSGVEQSLLENGMKRFGSNIADAAKGNKALAKEFGALGISIKGTNGKLRPMEEVFTDTVEAISKLPDPMARSRAAMKLFGKSGIDMTRLFEIGAKGMNELREEARNTGHVMSQEAAEFSEVFGDNVERLQKRWEGFKTFLGVQLMPVFNELVVNITAWVDENQKLIRSTATEWVKALAKALRELMDPTSEIRVRMREFWEGIQAAGRAIKPFVDLVGGPLNASLIALGGWILGPTIAALVALGAAFVKLGVVIMSTPFGWILAGVAAVAASVYVLYQKWDEFVAYWGNLWGRISAAFEGGFINGILAMLREFNPITHILRGMNAVFEYFTGIDLIAQGEALLQSFVDGVNSVTFDLATWIAEKIEPMISAITGFAGRIYDAGAALVTALWDGLKSKWGEVVAWLKGSVRDLISWLPESVQSTLGFDINATVTKPAEDAGASVSEAVKAPGKATAGLLKPASEIIVDRSRIGRGADPFTVVPSVARQATIPFPTFTPENQPKAVEASTVEAGTMTAGNVQFPEPILAHEPQNIDASTKIESLTINAKSDAAADIRAAVNAALAENSRRSAAAVKSSLSD